MKWQSIMWIAGIVIAVLLFNSWWDRVDEERDAARTARNAEIQSHKADFLASTGTSEEWLEDIDCDNYDTPPLYQIQRAIEASKRAAFVARVDDIVLLDGALQVRATYNLFLSCLLAPTIVIHAWITEAQNAALPTGFDDQSDRYLFAVEISRTAPHSIRNYDNDETGILVTGRLIDVTPLEPDD